MSVTNHWHCIDNNFSISQSICPILFINQSHYIYNMEYAHSQKLFSVKFFYNFIIGVFHFNEVMSYLLMCPTDNIWNTAYLFVTHTVRVYVNLYLRYIFNLKDWQLKKINDETFVLSLFLFNYCVCNIVYQSSSVCRFILIFGITHYESHWGISVTQD